MDGSAKVAKLLLDNGADISAKDGIVFSRTPLDYALENGHKALIELLRDRSIE
jgi:ankyrin repeat protein